MAKWMALVVLLGLAAASYRCGVLGRSCSGASCTSSVVIKAASIGLSLEDLRVEVVRDGETARYACYDSDFDEEGTEAVYDCDPTVWHIPGRRYDDPFIDLELVRIRTADGDIVQEYDADSLEWSTAQPNGADCGPTCTLPTTP